MWYTHSLETREPRSARFTISFTTTDAAMNSTAMKQNSARQHHRCKAAVAVSALLLALAMPIPAPAVTGNPGNPAALAPAQRRNPSLSAYTFHMTVAMAMRHFPWLHFHMEGTGHYVRGEDYGVRFTKMPFFARSFKQIDLSPLDPSMWPKRYLVSVVDQNDGMTTFALREKLPDPHERNPLVEALVTLDAHYSTRQVVLHYANGVIQLSLTPTEIQGYRLPTSGVVSINMPGEALSAHANFTNYAITPNAGSTGTSAIDWQRP